MTVAGPRRILTGFPASVRLFVICALLYTRGAAGVKARRGSAEPERLELVFIEAEVMADLVEQGDLDLTF